MEASSHSPSVLSIRQSSGEQLLLMSIIAGPELRGAIERELERRARPQWWGRLASRGANEIESIETAEPAWSAA